MATADYPDWTVSQVAVDSPVVLLDTVATKVSGQWISDPIDVSAVQSIDLTTAGGPFDVILVTLAWGSAGTYWSSQQYMIPTGDTQHQSPALTLHVPARQSQLQITMEALGAGGLNSHLYVVGSHRPAGAPIVCYGAWGTPDAGLGQETIGGTTYGSISTLPQNGTWHLYPTTEYAGLQALYVQAGAAVTAGVLTVTVIDEYEGAVLGGFTFQSTDPRPLTFTNFYAANPFHIYIHTSATFAPATSFQVTLLSGAAQIDG